MLRPALTSCALLLCAAALTAQAPARVVTATLAYGKPGNGPAPNFSPKGTQVALTDLPASARLPAGAVRPARVGTMEIGPAKTSWLPMLTTADADHPKDLCRIYLDRNRNGNFDDDGPALSTVPTLNDKTKAFWSSFAKTEITVPYGRGVVEPYFVSFWIVREGEEPPAIARFSVASWRAGTVKVNGLDALIAVMDSNNDALFDKQDYWSVLGAGEKDAAKRVLTITEARNTSRMMFIGGGPQEIVLEFRGLQPDGRSIDFAVVDRPVTKAEDRAPDDMLATERPRPRATTAFTWKHGDFAAAMSEAKSSGRKLLIDFETTWCGPCKTMDDWIWNDAEVAARLNAGYVGVKLDGDIEKALVKQFAVKGYPTGLILDPAGQELARFVGYQSSKDVLGWLK